MYMEEECPYCRDEKPECLVGGKEFGDDEFAEIENNTIYIEQWVGSFTSNPQSTTMSIDIDYCPKCGRDLTK